MKKLLGLLLAVIMICSLFVACAAESDAPASDAPASDAPASDAPSDDAADDEAAADEEDEFFVGLAFGGLDAVPTIIMENLTAKMDELGWKYVVTNGDLDQNKYFGDLETLCQQNPDLILTRSPNNLAVPNAAKICEDAGIPMCVMSLASRVGLEGVNFLTCIGDDDNVRGVPLGEWISEYAKANNFTPKIGWIIGDGSIDSKDNCERSIDIRENLTVEYEDVITAAADPTWSAAGGMKIMEDWLQRYTLDEMNTICVWSDEMCVGVIQALQAAGVQPGDYLITSYDGLDIIKPYVEEGWVSAVSALDLEQQSDRMIEVCQKFKDGEEIADIEFAMSIYIMTPDNMNDEPEYWDYSYLVA